jgi:putative NIF3 family GTP cyclohydrolase 1 type 2
VQRVAICTGGAQRLFHDLVALPEDERPDLFITGEMSLPQYYLAKESGVAYLKMGHHNSELFGVRSLLKGIELLGVETVMFNDYCPV